MTTDTDRSRPAQRLWIAVPAVSFGGIGIGVLLSLAGLLTTDLPGIAGCVIASCALFYQAYLKPRKDIVSLFTPLYAFLIFIVPNDFSSGPIVQTFYAATITLLSVRVERLFNAPKPGKKSMKQILNEYIGRLEPIHAVIDEETGHLIAQGLLTYKFGLYGNAVEKITAALARLEKVTPRPGALERALLVLRERAVDFADSRVTTSPEQTFLPEDYDNLAIRLTPDQIEDPAALDLDNALVLLYAGGIETSPDDEQALEEHQRFIIQILDSYKDKLTA